MKTIAMMDNSNSLSSSSSPSKKALFELCRSYASFCLAHPTSARVFMGPSSSSICDLYSLARLLFSGAPLEDRIGSWPAVVRQTEQAVNCKLVTCHSP